MSLTAITRRVEAGRSSAARDDNRLARMTAAIDAVVAVPVDDMGEAALQAELAVVDRDANRLHARRTRLAGELASCRAARASRERPDDVHAAQRAAADTQRQLADRLRWTPSQAKRAVTTSQRLETLVETRQAFDAGELSQDHASVVADTLRHLDGAAREDTERRLLAAARTEDPVALGRTARRLLATVDQQAAVDAARTRHARRYARMTQTPHGTLAIHAELVGIGAETAATAIHAFRTRDPVDATDRRTPEQATADALAAALRAALDAGVAPTQHGERPHVNITVDWRDLIAQAGVAEATHMGPLLTSEILRLLDDAGVSRILTRADSLPLDVGQRTRNVPAGAWRAVVARDRHCTWPGCHAPPEWCQAAHAGRAWWQGGPVSSRTLTLLCGHHHTRADDEGWTITVKGTVVWFTPPGGGRARTRGDGRDPP